jgi:homoserine dehydrogenase
VADPAESVALPAAFGDVGLLRDPQQLVVREDIDVVLDLTRGSDSSPLVREALLRRRNVVTPNKRLVHDHGPDLEALALQHGVRLAWHDSLAAGWPLMYALERPLVRSDLSGVEAVLSAAGNVFYEQLAGGADRDAALREAVERGLTEVDPELDLSGWDAAQKLALILTRITRQRVSVQDLDVHRLDDVDPALVRLVEAEGLCVRPVAWARIHADRIEATVRPMAVRRDSHLGANRGGNHVVVLHSREEGESVQMGRGAGTVPVATAVWNDLLGVLDPERSWTGRFPRAQEAPSAPRFGRFVRRREAGGGIERLDAAAAGAVPLLED